ncbi:hypothetical protein R3P38DRAFT_2842754, partial [Favolaschia claudopus]
TVPLSSSCNPFAMRLRITTLYTLIVTSICAVAAPVPPSKDLVVRQCPICGVQPGDKPDFLSSCNSLIEAGGDSIDASRQR